MPGHTRAEISEAWGRDFGGALSKAQLQYLKRLAKVTQGVRGGHATGTAPWNKGRPWDEWMSDEGRKAIAEGQMFKPGHRPHNSHHRLLDVRHDPQNGPMIYVCPRGAETNMQRWISLGRFEWMRANGRDFPEGHHLVHADRDKHNCDPDNLVAVPDDVYATVVSACRGKGIRYYDRASLEAAIALARLNRRRLELERVAPRDCAICGRSFVPPDYQRHYGNHVRICPACNKKRKEEDGVHAQAQG